MMCRLTPPSGFSLVMSAMLEMEPPGNLCWAAGSGSETAKSCSRQRCTSAAEPSGPSEIDW
eukprot:6728905-Pyramimonas_sp.AAC.1